LTEEAYYPELPETPEPRGVAKTSPELADELYLAPRANMKGRAISAQAAALVSFLDEAYPRPTEAGALRAPYRAGVVQTRKRCEGIAALLAELLIAAAVEEGVGWLMVSLDRRNYNSPSPVSWRTFEGIRQPWKDAGLLEENTGYPGILAFGNSGPMVGRMSRFRSTPKMLEICKEHGITVDNADQHFAVEFDLPSELVRLTRPSLPTRNTPLVQRLRDEVAALNVLCETQARRRATHRLGASLP
jgi:hypothetical protein